MAGVISPKGGYVITTKSGNIEKVQNVSQDTLKKIAELLQVTTNVSDVRTILVYSPLEQ
jgi:hypothetical protein